MILRHDRSSIDHLPLRLRVGEEGEELGHASEYAYKAASQKEERAYFEGFEQGEGEDGDLEAQIVRAVERVGVVRVDGECGVGGGRSESMRELVLPNTQMSR